MRTAPEEYCDRKCSALAFCKLIALCYFTAFAVIPITHIHMEERILQTFSSIGDSSHAKSFLWILHKVLSLHFKDRTDHTLSSRSIIPESPGEGNSLSTDSVSGTELPSERPGTGSFPYHPSGCGLEFMMQRGDAKAVDGCLLFPSGLSPPAV
ncbi:MAG: hypothetical protein ACM3MB_03700 [Acidobacteriota bacterium]